MKQEKHLEKSISHFPCKIFASFFHFGKWFLKELVIFISFRYNFFHNKKFDCYKTYLNSIPNLIVGKGGHTPPFLDPRCPHFSWVSRENESTE